MIKDNDLRELGRQFISVGKRAAEEVMGQLAHTYVTHGSDLRQKVWDGAGSLFSGVSEIPVRITRRAGEFVLEARLPGRDIESIEVVVLDDTVTIRGNKIPQPHLEGNSVLVTDEFEDGAVERTVRLPEVVDSSKVNAEVRRGVLRVVLGRREGLEVPISNQEG